MAERITKVQLIDGSIYEIGPDISSLSTAITNILNDLTLTDSNWVAGDIAFYDSEADSNIIVHYSDWNTDDYPVDRYTPIGVVAIPASHDVYGDGKCGVISLKNMSITTPDTGTTSTGSMYWGGYGTDTSIPNYVTVSVIGTALTQSATADTISNNAYLPSDNLKVRASVVDPEAYYAYDSAIAAPSPYLTDGSRNSNYYINNSANLNALSDFDGIGNTGILLSLATAEDWKTLDTITNGSSATYYPAAECTWRFHTSGTNQGDWYLPACGELGYAVVRMKAINTTISALNDVYGIIGSTIASNYYWSSSEYSSYYASYINFSLGSLNYDSKNANYYVRAFLRMSYTAPDNSLADTLKCTCEPLTTTEIDDTIDELYSTTLNRRFGDIVFYDNDNSKMISVAYDDENLSLYADGRFTPIGIVMDTVTDESTIGIMSLKLMDNEDPINGSWSGNALYLGSTYDSITDNPWNQGASSYDYDGEANTDIMLDSYTNTEWYIKANWWKLVNYEDYPVAAACCRLFKTDGTSLGDWYLPAVGEFTEAEDSANISLIFTIFNSVSNNVVGYFSPILSLGTSSELYYNGSQHVEVNLGDTTRPTASYLSYVRAFLRLEV